MAQYPPGNDDPAAFLSELAASHGKPQPRKQPPAADGTIDLKCQCGTMLRVKSRLAGQTVRCPACRTALTVPSPEPAEPAPIAIDPAAAAPASFRRRRRRKSTTAGWLIAVGVVLAVCVPLVYFLAFHKSATKPKPADASLAAKSAAKRGPADPKEADDAALPRQDADPFETVPGETTEDDTGGEFDPAATTSPAGKAAGPPPIVVDTGPAKTPSPGTVGDGRKTPETPAEPTAAVSEEKFDWLIGKSRTITLHNGAVYEDVEIASVRPGPQPRSLHSLKLKRDARTSARKRKRVPSQIAGWKIHVVETPEARLTLKNARGRRLAVVEAVVTRQQLAAERARKRAEIVARLQRTGNRIWPELSKEDHAKAVAEYKKFLIKVGKSFSGRNMKFRETKYFLFYTNLPRAEVDLISKRLDAMYNQLCTAFGIPRGKNVWRGKSVIVAFIHPQDFQKFETEFYGLMSPPSVHGRSHQSLNGQCITSCYRGTQFDFFAQVLVHETSHGFLHRFYSSADIPNWVNEGIADWIADKVVPACDGVRTKQGSALARIRTTHTLGGDFFTRTKIAGWQYGVASHLVEFMLRGKNRPKYRRFIGDIKRGYTWRESLKRNYGVDEKGLTALYGRSLGIPNLVP